MPVSGLVITLADRPNASSTFAAACAGEDRIMLGEPTGDRWPIVLDTQRPGEADQLHDWLLTLPEVDAADVVYVAFDEPTSPHPSSSNLSTEPRP